MIQMISLHVDDSNPELFTFSLFSVFSGSIVIDEFVTTTASQFLGENEDDLRLNCVGCIGFADSLQLRSGVRANGWCVHTNSLASVVAFDLEEVPEEKLVSAFEAYVRSQLEATSPEQSQCVQLKKWRHITKYLVILSESEANSSNLRKRFSVCACRHIENEFVVTCSDPACKKGKQRKLKNIDDDDSTLCGHLRYTLSFLTTQTNLRTLEVSVAEEDSQFDGK